MPDWLLWLIAAGVLAAAEAATLTLVLIMVAGGAAAGAVTAAFGAPVGVQFLVALVATLALLGAVRPVARRHLSPSASSRSGIEALVGARAVVLSRVDAAGGRVRLQGAEWSARAFDEREVLAAGAAVRVVQIDGATALVLGEGTLTENDPVPPPSNEEQS